MKYFTMEIPVVECNKISMNNNMKLKIKVACTFLKTLTIIWDRFFCHVAVYYCANVEVWSFENTLLLLLFLTVRKKQKNVCLLLVSFRRYYVYVSIISAKIKYKLYHSKLLNFVSLVLNSLQGFLPYKFSGKGIQVLDNVK